VAPGSVEDRGAAKPASVEDRWILSRLQRAKAEVSERIERYDFSHAALAVYDFVYGELCDWYLELVKPRLRAGERELSATLLHVLTETVALAHPLIPFETEEIYSHIPGCEGLLASRVVVLDDPVDEAAEAAVGRLIEGVQAVRGWRDMNGVKAGVTVSARLDADGYQETAEQLARLARVQWVKSRPAAGADPQAAATVPVPGGAVEILASDELDLGAAERKQAGRRAKLEAEIERARRKLANQGFVAKAPAAVVEEERAKLERLDSELSAL
jgi:valyl-tRNA synthetase